MILKRILLIEYVNIHLLKHSSIDINITSLKLDELIAKNLIYEKC